MSADLIDEPRSETETPGEVPEHGSERYVEEELLVEEISIDGMCGVY
jgi:mycofactocin precursor